MPRDKTSREAAKIRVDDSQVKHLSLGKQTGLFLNEVWQQQQFIFFNDKTKTGTNVGLRRTTTAW